MTLDNIDDDHEFLQQLLAEKIRRMQTLRLRQAQMGSDLPPHYEMEIGTLEGEISALRQRLQPPSQKAEQQSDTITIKEWPYRDGPLLGLYIYILTDSLKSGRQLAGILYEAGAAHVHIELGMKKAKDSLEEPAPHIVLVDYKSIGDKALSFIEWVKQQPHLQRTMCIALSESIPSNTNSQDVTDAFYKILNRDISDDELLTIMQEAAHNRPITKIDSTIPKTPSIVAIYYYVDITKYFKMMAKYSLIEHDITIFANGLDVLDYCNSHTIPLIFTSNRVYGIDWIEFIKQLRHLNPNIKVALVYAGLSDKERDQARDVGIDYYLSVPFSIDEAEIIVRDALGEVSDE